MDKKNNESFTIIQFLSLITLALLSLYSLSCATKTRATRINDQRLPIEDQKAIYDLLVRTALDNMRNSFNWSILNCYVKFPEEISFGQEIISSYDFPVPLRPSSECKKIRGRGIDAQIEGITINTGEVLIVFDSMYNVKDNSVCCGFGWFDANLSSHMWGYEFEKTDGKWTIRKPLYYIKDGKP